MSTATETETNAAEQEIRQRLSRLLGDHDPKRTPPEEFWGAQFDLGLAWVWYPEGLGGLGVSPGLHRLVTEALRAAGAPSNLGHNPIGLGMAAPTLLAHGSEDLRRRHLRPLFCAEEIWCQLFSEPSAGSDVAGLSTRAVRDGDQWIVNGQKVWTSLAHRASFGLLLARTDPDVPKHRGLTYFVVDMHAPGVEVRPLRQMTGDAEFNEVFLTDTPVPDTDRLGEVGMGWQVAITTLMNERVAIGGLAAGRGSGAIAQAVRIWKQRGLTDPVLRDRLMSCWVDAEVHRLTAMRAAVLRQAGTPGPEGSVGKLAVAELNKAIYDCCVDLLGADGMLYQSYEMSRPDSMGFLPTRDVQRAFLRSRANSIEGGTSEIMRNILGERVLGLPREPRVDRDVAWSEVPRS
jgi:alkylation response protein AidB-like acyl-CoA dehydrogenase